MGQIFGKTSIQPIVIWQIFTPPLSYNNWWSLIPIFLLESSTGTIDTPQADVNILISLRETLNLDFVLSDG